MSVVRLSFVENNTTLNVTYGLFELTYHAKLQTHYKMTIKTHGSELQGQGGSTA